MPQAAIAQEQLYDELADKLGMDPLEFRILNALRADQPTVTGQVLGDGVGFRACLEALRPHWQRAREDAAAFNAANAADSGAASASPACGMAAATPRCRILRRSASG